MAEQATEVVKQVETQVEPTKQVESQEIDYKKEYEKLYQLTEKQKSEISGLDKRVSEETKQKLELLKKTETTEQTAERERLDREEREKQERILRDKEKSETLSEINRLKVEREALKQGFTDEEIEELGFKDVESVTRYKKFLDNKLTLSKEQQNKEIESALSGSRDKIDKNVIKTDELSPLERKIISRR